jgi:solute carrier family 25 carnitine/acylcarnitine transporter 20/29
MEHKQELGHKEPHHHHHHHHIFQDDHDNHRNGSIPQQLLLQQTQQQQHVEDIYVSSAVEEQDVSFFHDFIAGGIAGSASVVVGHPMDTIKVRMQTSSGNVSMWSLAKGYGGVSGLFRGISAPLSTACVINAIIFSSYGWSSRMYDQYYGSTTDDLNAIHDSSTKAFLCGSFSGLVQALVICPQEHVKCRLQIQHGAGSPDNLYKGPVQAAKSIFQNHGLTGLYRGWCITCWREIPAFGAYFAFYDIFKDQINAYFINQEKQAAAVAAAQAATAAQAAAAALRTMSDKDASSSSFTQVVSTSVPPAMAHHSHTWVSSALAGGFTGALTWAMVYPFDVIKTQIQTMPLTEEASKRRIHTVTQNLIRTHGWKHLFRGLTVTCLRAFPVNGIIFPVYEYTLMHICALEY